MELSALRVDDRRRDEHGRRHRFASHTLPPYMRRSSKVAEVLPILYLRGLSTGDFRPALEALLQGRRRLIRDHHRAADCRAGRKNIKTLASAI